MPVIGFFWHIWWIEKKRNDIVYNENIWRVREIIKQQLVRDTILWTTEVYILISCTRRIDGINIYYIDAYLENFLYKNIIYTACHILFHYIKYQNVPNVFL